MHVRSEEIKPKLVIYIGKIGGRIYALSAFWRKNMRSEQKIALLCPELTLFG